MNDTEFEPLLRVLRSEAADLTERAEDRIDTARAWREFRALRDRASRNRRRRYTLIAAAATASAVILAAVTVAVLRVAGPGPTRNQSPTGPGERHITGPSYVPPDAVRRYPHAVAVRVPVAGVQNLSEDGRWLWAVQVIPPPGPVVARHFNLLKIDTGTGSVMLSVNLGQSFGVVAAGAGTVWLTRPDQARQVARINPATGKVMSAVKLPAVGNCGYLTFVAAALWAECGSGKRDSIFLRLDPVTGHVLERLGPVRGPIGFQSAFTPRSVWFSDNYAGLNGVVPASGLRGSRVLTARDAAYPQSFVYTQSLVYAAGAVWALNSDESVAKIDPVTGHVERVFTCRNYDPACQGALAFMTAGQGSLWFLNDGYSDGHRTTSVLRVSMATGKPLGEVTIKPGSCGEPCYQIYDAGGTIWVPTLTKLVGIDPARLPSRS